MLYNVIVVGAGMIGAAAGRYLAEMGLRVAVIGPAEPDHWQTHQGVFASHYDQGRITRIIDTDPVWALLAQRSIAAYADLEARSGVHFHEAVGGLQLVAAPADDEKQQARLANGTRDGATFQSVDADDLKSFFPFFQFPPNFIGIWEQGSAGYVNPRSLVAAQLTVAQQHGAHLIRETVTAVTPQTNQLEIKTAEGRHYQTQKVLVATGSFSNCHALLAGRTLDLYSKARTITLAEVEADEVQRLAAMPTLIAPIADNPHLASVYVLPPIQYPDNRWYIKLGGNNYPERSLSDLGEFVDWFHAEGDAGEADHLRAALLALIPDLRVRAFGRKACVLAYTAHGYPYIDSVIDGRLYVAVGGCGSAAKSSNEIGRMGALLTAHEGWTHDLAAHHFQAIYVSHEEIQP